MGLVSVFLKFFCQVLPRFFFEKILTTFYHIVSCLVMSKHSPVQFLFLALVFFVHLTGIGPLPSRWQANDTIDKEAVQKSDQRTWAASQIVWRCPTLLCASMC